MQRRRSWCIINGKLPFKLSLNCDDEEEDDDAEDDVDDDYEDDDGDDDYINADTENQGHDGRLPIYSL